VGISAFTFFILGLVFTPEQLLPWLLLLGASALALSAPKRGALLLGCLVTAFAIPWTLQHGYRQALLVILGSVFLIGCLLTWIKLKKPSLAFLTTLSLGLGLLISFSSNYAYNNFLEPHQQERIKVWLKPSEADPEGAAYNLIFSKMAIGSGGLYGKGLLKGDLTQGNFVPEQITDFIFCTIGEEQGFIGSFGLLVLFLMFLWRIVVIAERQNSLFSKYYAYGVAGIFFIHIFINIGMTMGLTPIIGIPLPFLSKGGSSLLGFTLMLAVLLKLDRHRLEIKI
ncbi:MAG: rod shape-determining protein RodA, partial [Bacteroidetes bacterium]